MTVAFANRIMHKEKQNLEGVKRILEVHALSTSWRNTFEKRMRGEEMNTKERLEGKNNKKIFINGAFLLVKRIRKRYFYIINLLIFKNLNIFYSTYFRIVET